MNRADFFIHCASLALQKVPIGMDAVVILGKAASLHEDALPRDVERIAEAAVEFVLWHYKRNGDEKHKPEFLKAHEEGQANVVVVTSNLGATLWWQQAEAEVKEIIDACGDPEAGADGTMRQLDDKIPRAAQPLILGNRVRVELSRQDAERFKAWVTSIAGSEQEPFEFAQP
jgi:hypothetical protein